jgi:hypothetical protein
MCMGARVCARHANVTERMSYFLCFLRTECLQQYLSELRVQRSEEGETRLKTEGRNESDMNAARDER